MEPNEGDIVDQILMQRLVVDSNHDGVVFTKGTSNSTLEDSTITGSVGWGVHVSTGTSNLISGCTIQGNGSGGIYLKSAGHTASGNTVRENGGDGIYTEAVIDWENGDIQQNQILDNVSSDNAGRGVGIDYSHENVVSGNTLENNGEHGIFLTLSHRNVLSGNTLTANSQSEDAVFDHIYLDYANDNVITQNIGRMGSLTNRPGYGVHIRPAASTGNQVTDNDMVGSGVSGSFLDEGTGTVDTGNQW
jgi:parallel beta-helix repeat protein